MRKNRYAAFLLWTFLALLCWGTALGGFLENRRGNQEFTAYYDSPVLNGKEMEIFIREREEEGLPLTAAWKEEEKESFAGSLGAACQGTFLKARGEMGILFPNQLVRGNFPWNGDDQGCVISRGLSQELSAQIPGWATKFRFRERLMWSGESWKKRKISWPSGQKKRKNWRTSGFLMIQIWCRFLRQRNFSIR